MGGRAQRLVASVPKKPTPYFGKVTTFVVQASVAPEAAVLASGDYVSAEEATQRLAESLRRRGVRVTEGDSVRDESAAFVNLALELGKAPDAHRFGYRLSVTREREPLPDAFGQDVPAYLHDRRAGTIAVSGQGGKAADLELIESIANDVVKLVPKEKRGSVAADEIEKGDSQPNLASVVAFVVRTRFDFDDALESRKGYWTAGSAKAYLTKLLTDRGLKVVDSAEDAIGKVAFVNHWVKGKPNARPGADGFDYRYEAFYAVTQSDLEYRPLLESRDKGAGDFDFFEEGERLELERYADELAQAYRASR